MAPNILASSKLALHHQATLNNESRSHVCVVPVRLCQVHVQVHLSARCEHSFPFPRPQCGGGLVLVPAYAAEETRKVHNDSTFVCLVDVSQSVFHNKRYQSLWPYIVKVAKRLRVCSR